MVPVLQLTWFPEGRYYDPSETTKGGDQMVDLERSLKAGNGAALGTTGIWSSPLSVAF